MLNEKNVIFKMNTRFLIYLETLDIEKSIKLKIKKILYYTNNFRYNIIKKYKKLSIKKGIKMEEIGVLINKPRLEKRIEQLAKKIEKDYEGKDLIFVGILKGSVMFMTELAKRIKNNVELDFMDVSSYEGTESTGKVKINKDIRSSIKGKEVIIIEDIIDTGRTLTYITQYLKEKEPKSLKIATMLSKPSRRIMELDVNYIGFCIEDKFVVGYGLDYNEKYRNLPYIGYIEK